MTQSPLSQIREALHDCEMILNNEAKYPSILEKVLACYAALDKVEEELKPTLYDGLCKAIIARILEAKSDCEPEHDILLRLETIIRQRDYFEAKILKAEKEVEKVKEDRKSISEVRYAYKDEVERLRTQLTTLQKERDEALVELRKAGKGSQKEI